MIAAILTAGSGSPSWAGSVPTWALLVMAIIVAWRVTKGGAGSAVSELSAANSALEKSLDKSKSTAETQAKQIAALEAKTDVVLAVTPLMAEHERHAQERHTATIEVLEAIRDQIHADTTAKEHE